MRSLFEIRVFDKNGTLLTTHNQRSHSWVKNAYDLLFSNLAGMPLRAAEALDVYKTDGTQKTSDYIGYFYQTGLGKVEDAGYGYRGAAGSVTRGIVLGTATTAEDFDSSNAIGYALGALIANGSSTGEMDYTQGITPAYSLVGTTKKATHIRYINNNSGAAITVNEVGLYGNYVLANGVSQYMMVSRDKLGAGVAVADTGQLKVTYTIQLTYPA